MVECGILGSLIINLKLMNTYIKISDTEIRVSKTDTTTKETIYTLDYLLSQKKAIEEQKAREIKQRDLELVEVNALILEAQKLGIKETIKEEIK